MNSKVFKKSKKQITFELIEGSRRGSHLLHSVKEAQLYMKNKKLSDGSVAYTCRERSCNARVYIHDGKCFLSEPFSGHLHVNKKQEIEDIKLLSKIKNDVAEAKISQVSSGMPEVRKIFEDSVSQSSKSKLVLKTHLRNLQKIRSESLSKAPKTVAEIKESNKYIEFQRLVESGEASVPNKRRVNKKRAAKISEASDLLDENQIGAEQFLCQVTYEKYGNSDSVENFEFFNVEENTGANVEINDEFYDSDDSKSSQSIEVFALRINPCCICQKKISQTTFFPCGHLKVCYTCWLKEVNIFEQKIDKYDSLSDKTKRKAEKPTLKCPTCLIPVENYVKTVF